MESIPLKELVADKGQAEVARIFGVTAPAINKALSSNRDVRCTQLPDGTYLGEEVRPFPFKPSKSAA